MAAFLNFTSQGAGKVVVFLHGYLESKTMWNYFDFPPDFHAIFIDLPGHGQSDLEWNNEPSMDQMADDVLSLLKHLNIENFSIVGHSMGGYVALSILRKSAAVEKVILLNSHFWEDSPLKKKDRVRIADIVFTHKNQLIREMLPNLFFDKNQFLAQIEALIQEASEMSPEAIAYAALAMRNRENMKSFLKTRPQKVACILGEFDSLIPVDLFIHENEELNLNYQIIENAGHMAHIENTFETKKQLLSMLSIQTTD